METPEKIIKTTRPFFLNFFNKLSGDLKTLTAASVVCTLGDIAIVRGQEETSYFFETDRSVAYAIEDGSQTGDIHIVFDLASSIALTGLMMMMGEAVIRDQVKTREFNEEIQEGFQEVANQVVGAMNALVERKQKGGHLFLDNCAYYPYGETPPTLKESTTYLAVSVDIQVSNFQSQTAVWLMSKGFAEALLGIEIEGSEEEKQAQISKEAPASSKPELSSSKGGGAAASFSEDDFMDGEVEEENPAQAILNAPTSHKNVRWSTEDGLPSPDDEGSVKAVMVDPPFTLKEDEKVIKAINTMRQDGVQLFGIERAGKLVRVVSASDLRHLMGPFFGTKAMNARDKAICAVEIGKINADQRLIRIPITGTINQAADLITEFNLRSLPVISKGGVLRGFVPAHAVLTFFRKKRRQ
ncbi:MAG: CBS domain-containing protein [Magnetococcus sp. DMHC-6]